MIIDILESVPRKYHPRIHTQHNDKRDECHLLQKEAHDEKRWSLHIYYGIYILRKYHLLAMVMTDCTIYGQPGIQRCRCAQGGMEGMISKCRVGRQWERTLVASSGQNSASGTCRCPPPCPSSHPHPLPSPVFHLPSHVSKSAGLLASVDSAGSGGVTHPVSPRDFVLRGE